jgi:mannose-1-phosphate guanylyltransferase/mannose-6-phosphate isomerase
MIQETVLRANVPNAVAPVLLCGEEHRFHVAEQMQTIGISPHAIVLEPFGRNTAAAAAIAALLTAEEDPKGIVLLLPSDHVVQDIPAFEEAVVRATAAAKAGYVVTFGIAPESAETGYGYIQRGQVISNLFETHIVKRFTEKPHATMAAEYIASGDYSWNSGMFVFRADTMLAELDRHVPGLVQACKAALDDAKRDLDFIRLDPANFEKVPNISIDYAVLEKTDKAAVVSCALGWSDVGAWSSLWALQSRDTSGNVLQGDVVVYKSSDSFVRSDKGLTALVGVKDLVVVVTDDAVLVADKHSTQDVKEIVDKLKATERPEHAEHTTVFRPWGSYQSIDSGPGFQVKEILVKPGGKLSLQMHHHRAEHWVVVEGTARVTCDDKVFTLDTNESTFIPLGAKHRLENPGKLPLRLIEVQSGAYLGEDDIVRFDDIYGRATETPTLSIVREPRS